MTKQFALLLGGIILFLIIAAAVLVFFLTGKSRQPNSATNPNAIVEQAKTIPPQPVVEETVSTVSQIKLTITSPKNNDTVSTSTITIVGETVPNADISVNDTETKANSAGKFSVTLNGLVEGLNPIIVTASDENGNYSEQELSIVYEPK